MLTIVLVNFCRIPLAETVGADTLITQILTVKSKLLLYGSGGHREHKRVAVSTAAETIIFHIPIDHKGNSENTLFPFFAAVWSSYLLKKANSKIIGVWMIVEVSCWKFILWFGKVHIIVVFLE